MTETNDAVLIGGAEKRDIDILSDSPEIRRNLMFRDRLRSHLADRQRYEDAKGRLATQSWPDMNAYAEAKTNVIESIIAAAAADDPAS